MIAQQKKLEALNEDRSKKEGSVDKSIDESKKNDSRSQTARNRRSKYGNHKVEIGSLKFDSKKEAARYAELLVRADKGEIEDLKLQHHFTLQEPFVRPDGEKVKRVEYIADFTYFEDGVFVVEDVKSAATRKNPVYSVKKRLMAGLGFVIREV